jgi:integrase
VYYVIDKMKAIDEYLKNYEKPNTIKNYKKQLNKYFDFIGINADEYITQKRDFDKDFKEYYQSLTIAPVSKKGYLTTIKSFLEYNDIIIKPKTIKFTIKKVKARPILQDNILTTKQFNRVMENANLMEKALFMFVTTSGLRIDCEALKIEKDDIIWDSKPVKIRVRGSVAKNGTPRVTFITDETKDLLLKWLKVRDTYQEDEIKRNRCKSLGYTKKQDDNRLFPIHYMNASRRWNALLKYSNLDMRDKDTGYHIYHIHTLRKYFSSRCSNAGIPEKIVYALMGQGSYLSEYKKFTDEELAKHYLDGKKALSVFGFEPDLTGVHEELKQRDTQMKDMLKEMELMKQKIHLLEMESKQKDMELSIEKIKNGKKA